MSGSECDIDAAGEMKMGKMKRIEEIAKGMDAWELDQVINILEGERPLLASQAAEHPEDQIMLLGVHIGNQV